MYRPERVVLILCFLRHVELFLLQSIGSNSIEYHLQSFNNFLLLTSSVTSLTVNTPCYFSNIQMLMHREVPVQS